MPRRFQVVRDVPDDETPPQHASRLVVVSNRAPYAHEWQPDGTSAIRRPASGLVTAIEPMLAATGGTWIAHASGSADRARTPAGGREAAPPGRAAYTLRRLWTDDAVYEKYYNGMANESLWPLCHQAYVKPAFRAADWEAYEDVNASFAAAAARECGPDGVLLVQDYHFALLPELVRRRAPHVPSSFFWHIPWPNADVVATFPRKERLLEGMLGADIIGFHTPQFCLNFLETVRRYLPVRVDLDEMSIAFKARRIFVRPYPISVEWPYPAASRMEGAALRSRLGIAPDAHVSISVDRMDYTKGLIERMAAVESLLQSDPSLHRRFVLVQIASPSRSGVAAYQKLKRDVVGAVERINDRLGAGGWQPVRLINESIDAAEVRRYYAMANSAVVTPLHDGMNLVAKEYVASCGDGDGVLVLSRFAGAAAELRRALVVNPYDIEEVARASAAAVRMPVEERRMRMQAMRCHIENHNIHHWSAQLIGDLHGLRGPRSVAPAARGAASRGLEAPASML